MRNWLKKIVHVWPWPLTLNEKYDRETRAVLKKVCAHDSICIDIGCFKGDILKAMLAAAPSARHIAFEPVPMQYEFLKAHFAKNVTIYPYALGNENKETPFHFVRSNPTYSGLQQRQYKGAEEIETIHVEVRKLDDVISHDLPVHLIKIDVEGGEFNVMQGAEMILKKWHPYLIFEHGLGGADKYGVTPGDVYSFLVNTVGYKILLMEDFLKGKKTQGFSKQQFEQQFQENINCYFLATYK